jgi:uncharacterized protein YkuJ
MKMQATWSYILLPLSILLIVATGCREQEEVGEEEMEMGMEEKKAMQEDVQHAKSLWTEMENYTNWPQPEGFKGWQEGKSPHGAYLRYYINDVAREELTKDGAIIVKENYSEESEGALKSLTIMQKREGYDPETRNWFYVKYSPDGKVMESNGRKMAGLVGKGKEKGCIPCHAGAGGNDYLFMNDKKQKEGKAQEKATDREQDNKDTRYAETLWSEIEDYPTWPQPEGFKGWQEGKSPHGNYLQYYINNVAQQELTKDGAVIVKENYAEENEDTLKSITIMEKREGYDPETKNWFYVAYSPEGQVMADEQGNKMAGLVGKGQENGCLPCHRSAGDDDYLFMND